jgi:hypothetical protein
MVGRSTLGAALGLGARGVIVRCSACLNRRVFAPAQALLGPLPLWERTAFA